MTHFLLFSFVCLQVTGINKEPYFNIQHEFHIFKETL